MANNARPSQFKYGKIPMSRVLHIGQAQRHCGQEIDKLVLYLSGVLFACSLSGCVTESNKQEPSPAQLSVAISLGNLRSDDLFFSAPLKQECLDPANMDFAGCQPEPGPVSDNVRAAFSEALKNNGVKLADGTANSLGTYRLNVFHSTRGYNVGVCLMSGTATAVEVSQQDIKIASKTYQLSVPDFVKSESDLTPDIRQRMATECFGKFAREVFMTLRAIK